MSIPAADTPIPRELVALAAGAGLRPVWRNGHGGLTAATDDGRYIKYGPLQAETTAAGEAVRLSWAGRYARVPEVIACGASATHEWLITHAIEGRSAVDPRVAADPAAAVGAIGRGLRALHDALPVQACPFEWGVEGRIEAAEGRGIRVPDALRDAPPIDRLVVCHGDACAPNTLVGGDGAPVAHVDLGALGVADRWADIAVAAMSTEWNYGPGWHDALIDAYGVPPDRPRLAYYRELWNTT